MNSRLDPAESQLSITVELDQLTSSTQILGRLIGPICPYSTTVEVSYPLRETSRQYEKEGTPHIRARVVIPEASFWDPQTPFLYEGPIELWQKGERRDEMKISHGLRVFHLTPHGLRWNDRLLTLRGVECHTIDEKDALRLHRLGCNTLLAPVTNNQALWELADRLGFLMLGWMADRKTFANAPALCRHPSCLGWVLTSELLRDELVAAVLPHYLTIEGQLLGMELSEALSGPLPPGFQFVIGPESLLTSPVEIPLPKVIREPGPFPEVEGKPDRREERQVLGRICT